VSSLDWLRRALGRIARVLQQDRIRASAEPHALLRLAPDDWLTLLDEDYVVYSARGFRSGPSDVREYGLARGGEPAARLLVPIGAPDHAFLVLDEANGHPQPKEIQASEIVIYGNPGFGT
jgi:hypothetical protein